MSLQTRTATLGVALLAAALFATGAPAGEEKKSNRNQAVFQSSPTAQRGAIAANPKREALRNSRLPIGVQDRSIIHMNGIAQMNGVVSMNGGPTLFSDDDEEFEKPTGSEACSCWNGIGSCRMHKSGKSAGTCYAYPPGDSISCTGTCSVEQVDDPEPESLLPGLSRRPL